jgi:hypothetical protein
MIISNARIGMAAQHEYRATHEVSESLAFWAGNTPSVPAANPPEPNEESVQSQVMVDISAAGSLLAMHRQQQTLDLDTSMDQRSRLNLMILQAVFEAMTGRSLDLKVPSNEQGDNHGQARPTRELQVDTTPPQVRQPMRSTAGALVYQRHERYAEQETLRFNAEGVIKTQDGQEIRFSVSLGMSRTFIQESIESLAIMQFGAVNKVDPLVINFDGKGAALSQTRFAFDLDSNGTAEQIASLRPGSGFLALDHNEDGVINNGSELFGPSTGRGFMELAAYDEDGNQFIDEVDSIYHKLRIWMMNEDGSTQLMALGDKQIGAIFLGHVTSPFQLNDEQNNSLGEIANSGIYIAETGSVGVVQELNLTV